MSVVAQEIIDYLDPQLVKCYECHTFCQYRTAKTVMVEDGRDAYVCEICIRDVKKDDHVEFLIGEFDPEQRFCDICEEYKFIDDEWEERKDIWLSSGPESIAIYMSHIDCDWFCEGCAEILQDRAEEHDKNLCV